MARFRSRLATICAAVALSACSFSSDALWPSLTGGDPKAPSATAQNTAQMPAAMEQAGQSMVSPFYLMVILPVMTLSDFAKA